MAEIVRQKCMYCGSQNAAHAHRDYLCVECEIDDVYWAVTWPYKSHWFEGLHSDDPEYDETMSSLRRELAALRRLRARGRA